MKKIHEDLKNLFVEIPPVSNSDAHEKMNLILILYSKMLANMFQYFNISDYFSRLHIMSYDIKAIRNKHVGEQVKLETFNKTRAALINDMYELILLTAPEETAENYPQAL